MKLVMKILQQLLMKKKLKESNGMTKNQRSNTEKNNLIEEGKRKGIAEIIRQTA